MTDSIFEMKNLKKKIENEVVLTMEYSSDNVYRAKGVVLMG